MLIREATRADFSEWQRMRGLLWPDSVEDNPGQLEAYFRGSSTDVVCVFVAEDREHLLAGFIELNIRNFAEGSKSSPIPYIEGWYVDIDFRGTGLGRQLIETAESWALSQGYSEIASDAEIDNLKSIAVHKHLGFKETERVVCFLKPLG